MVLYLRMAASREPHVSQTLQGSGGSGGGGGGDSHHRDSVCLIIMIILVGLKLRSGVWKKCSFVKPSMCWTYVPQCNAVLGGIK